MRLSRALWLAVPLVLLGAVLLSQSWGQGSPKAPAETRIAVVDVVKIFDNYQRVKDFDAEIRRRSDENRKADEDLAKRIESMQKELEDLAPGSKRAEALLDQLMQLTVSRQTSMKLHEARVTRDRYRLTEDVYGELLTAAEAVARQGGFDIVLSSDRFSAGAKTDVYRQVERKKVLYARRDLDLTDAVLVRLNTAYRK